MAKDLNQVNLEGGLTKDPVFRQTASGFEFVAFTVATKRSWKNKQTDEWMEKVTYHNITSSSRDVLEVARDLTKGSRVRVSDGQIETRDYEDKDGQKRFVTEINIPPFGALENLGHQGKGGFKQEAVQDDVLDDDIPF